MCYTLLWYDTINTWLHTCSGMIPCNTVMVTHVLWYGTINTWLHTSLCDTIIWYDTINTYGTTHMVLWYDTINTYVTHFSGMIPLTHMVTHFSDMIYHTHFSDMIPLNICYTLLWCGTH